MNWFSWLFGGGKKSPANTTDVRGGDLVARASAHTDNPFVADVLKHYRRSGTMSPKQAAALQRIVLEREEEARRPAAYLGRIGDDIMVEGEVGVVEYRGKGKTRQGRYVIWCNGGVAVFDGPAVLVGRLGAVKFRARVISHEDGDTHVANPRDIVVVRRPSDPR